MRCLSAAAAALLCSCFLEPEYTFSVEGTVIEEVSGAAIPDARVELRFRQPLTSWSEYPVLLAATNANGEGYFRVVTGAPPGYDRANCATLALRVTAAGYAEVPIHGVAGNEAPVNSDGEDPCADGEAEAFPVRMRLSTGSD
jgi:hypothetical protein